MPRIPFFLLALGAALSVANAPAPAAAAEATMASITRGGRLYDNWFKELNQPPPAAANPAWPVGVPAPADAARTWLCVDCHGWTYQGGAATGVRGIDGMAGADSAGIVAVLKAPGHGYGELLHDRDLDDLAAFVAHGQSHLVADIAANAPPAAGEGKGAVYQTVCARCHGGDGKQVESIPPLGDVARENPWMVMHNILNGHAGGVMPSLRALDEALALDTLAALQGLPPTEPAAAIARGGRLYGDWIKETGRSAPREVHPAWTGKAPASPGDTWRCRDCHGWDYQGKDGPAARMSPAPAGGLALKEGAPPEAILAILTDDTHRYGGKLTYRDLSDLAAFVSQGQFRMGWAIDAETASFHGRGEGYGDHYQTLCASCHGATGTAVRTMSPLGRMVRENPWRALHNVLNGHAGESMPPMRVFPPDMAAAILAYVENTLPNER